jgi:hypothetical protein
MTCVSRDSHHAIGMSIGNRNQMRHHPQKPPIIVESHITRSYFGISLLVFMKPNVKLFSY